MTQKQIFGILFLIGALVAGFLAYAFFNFTDAQNLAYSDESGWIETVSPLIFVTAGLIGVFLAINRSSKFWAVYSFLMFAAAAREDDLHKEFTTDSILKSNFYQDPSVPLIEKLGGAIFILLLIYCVYFLIRTIIKQRHRLRFHNAPLMFGLSGLGAIALGKMLDSSSRLFPSLAPALSDYNAFKRLAEETLETTGAALFLICVICALLRK